MMSPELFQKMDKILRIARNAPHLRWGGVQVIFTGDFYQLPPVITEESEETRKYA